MQIIIENQYFPIIDWFKLSIDYSDYKIEQYENYRKMSFRNRCIISGSNGFINLTIPLIKGRGQKTLIKEIKMDDSENWRSHHWKSIVSSYSRSPFFEFYGEEVKRLLFAQNQYLFDHNLKIVERISSILKLDISLGLTESHRKEYPASETLDCRDKWLPKNYTQEEKSWKPKYTQVFEDKFGFLPNLSVLDLLFCKGSL